MIKFAYFERERERERDRLEQKKINWRKKERDK